MSDTSLLSVGQMVLGFGMIMVGLGLIVAYKNHLKLKVRITELEDELDDVWAILFRYGGIVANGEWNKALNGETEEKR